MADEIRTCADLEERLAAYVDGEDTLEERRLVEAHLALCPACRLTAETEAVSRDLIRDHRPALCADAPSGLKARCAAVARVEARHAAEAEADPSAPSAPSIPSRPSI